MSQSQPAVGYLIFAVVAITTVVCLSIVALEAWQPGSNTAAITALLSVAAPAVSILLVLLQGQRTAARVDEAHASTAAHVEEIRQDVRQEAQVTAAKVEQKTEEAQARTSAKVDEVKDLVDNKQADLQRRISDLERWVRKEP